MPPAVFAGPVPRSESHLKENPGHGFGLLFDPALSPKGFGKTRGWRVLRIEIDTSLPSQRVIRALDELVELRGAPRRLRLDNGPEFISAALRQWAQHRGIELIHIQPGKPTQNAYIERFNRTFRTEVLDRYVFTNLNEVRRMAEDWRH